MHYKSHLILYSFGKTDCIDTLIVFIEKYQLEIFIHSVIQYTDHTGNVTHECLELMNYMRVMLTHAIMWALVFKENTYM